MKLIEFESDHYFKIENHDAMRPFFMSIVSDANHWMFLSSTGGLTAGRKDAEHALFPYYTVDKIHDSYDTTGCKTIIRVVHQGRIHLWEPFSFRFKDAFKITRNLYKSILGNKVIFEEVNHTLGLIFKYKWSNSKSYGFIRQVYLENVSDQKRDLQVLDGFQNILPYGVGSYLQNNTSNLVDAYKRSELLASSGIGIFALSSIISDKAEPSEALKSNTVWSLGLHHSKHLLSSQQIEAFRQSQYVQEEKDVKGERGAYFIISDLTLPKGVEKTWLFVANVNQTQSQVAWLDKRLKDNPTELLEHLNADIRSGDEALKLMIGSSDGFIKTSDQRINARHYSNTLFNLMRGGIFDRGYRILKRNLAQFIFDSNRTLFAKHEAFLETLADETDYFNVSQQAYKTNDLDLIRICSEYLPIGFSRRHGDPSRPWNLFSINTHDETTGEKLLSYEGNWRDLFQNWEALALSYPGYLKGMIFKFLNASTFEGYNPYRITSKGYDWEVIEPDNPWSYIGYWGDHQVIYLLKFLELAQKFELDIFDDYLDKEYFVYAGVPYKIKSYEQMLKNPKDTIAFDEAWDKELRDKRDQVGLDGVLLFDANEQIHHVTMLEKLMTLCLSKMSNLIIGAGIWMNTQRPEWNDANNALVGNGVSVVTLGYLNRYLTFLKKLLQNSSVSSASFSVEFLIFLDGIWQALESNQVLLEAGSLDMRARKNLTDQLGTIASNYRIGIYENGFSGNKTSLALQSLKELTELCLKYVQHSMVENKREDHLFHAYNVVSFEEDKQVIGRLDEMLEGQVAAISSGFLAPKEVLQLLESLKASSLFREDQSSYILYPDKALPGFMQKNVIPEKLFKQSAFLSKLIELGNIDIVTKDINGHYHFNGDIKNVNDLMQKLDAIYHLIPISSDEKQKVLDIYESVFNHKAFTGRSGTFFAYEGLGSIYWHMVSKLHLAVQEVCVQALLNGEDPETLHRLLLFYREIGLGIGVHKDPQHYGSFPTDPYSHTPKHRGVQQPGMTGQVKEDIITTFTELGILVKNGQIHFNPLFLTTAKFLKTKALVEYVNTSYQIETLLIPENTLFLTYCNIPLLYTLSDNQQLKISLSNGKEIITNELQVSKEMSKKIFLRNGEVNRIEIQLNKKSLNESV